MHLGKLRASSLTSTFGAFLEEIPNTAGRTACNGHLPSYICEILKIYLSHKKRSQCWKTHHFWSSSRFEFKKSQSHSQVVTKKPMNKEPTSKICFISVAFLPCRKPHSKKRQRCVERLAKAIEAQAIHPPEDARWVARWRWGTNILDARQVVKRLRKPFLFVCCFCCCCCCCCCCFATSMERLFQFPSAYQTRIWENSWSTISPGWLLKLLRKY